MLDERPPFRTLFPLAALTAALSAACATSPRAVPPPKEAPKALEEPALAAHPPAAELSFPPEEITVSPLDLELSGKNDEELFAIGTAAYGAKDFERAAAAFARIPDRFPGSPHEAAALFDAGLAYEELGKWELALERFRALAAGYLGRDALEAAFKVAECLYELGDLSKTHEALLAIAARPGLDPSSLVRVLTQLGVVELEDGRPDDAERTLRRALAASEAAASAEALDPYYPAQAEYYLGETYRGWFLALSVDPSTSDEEKLKETLEQKSEMLLSAQGHYLRAIRMGDDRWAIASGVRVAELYDDFRRQLLEAPLPPGLDEEAARAYREELRSRVRVLATKAVSAYEAALGRAARSGVDDLRFLGGAEEALQRLREALLDRKI